MSSYDMVPLNNRSNTKLLLRHAKADECDENLQTEFWDRVSRVVQPLAVKFSNGRLGKYYDQEDLESMARERVLDKVRVFNHRGPGSLEKWVYVVVKNHFLDALRALPPASVYPLPGSDSRLVPASNNMSGDHRTPSHAASDKEQHQRARDRYALLPEDARQILWLHKAEGMTVSETARCMGLNKRKTERVQSAALRKLRTYVDEES